MIRRDDKAHDWLLISQVTHADLAGEIARHWGNQLVEPLPFGRALLYAVEHHDDGWADWEAAPTIDPETGKPRNFTEMPMDVSTAIWQKSIAACAAISAEPRSGEARAGEVQAGQEQCSEVSKGKFSSAVWVSRHFCWLAEQARKNRPDNPDDVRACETFLSAQHALQERWMRESGLLPEEFDAIAELGTQFLQFFDRLSLWLCCAKRSTPDTLTIPGERAVAVTFAPLTDDRVLMTPNPLAQDSLTVDLVALRIPQRAYANDAELHAALRMATSERLTWNFVSRA